MPGLPKSKSFFKKLFLSFLAVSVVISALLCTFMTVSYQKNATAMLEQFYARVLKQTNYSVTYMNDLAKRATSSLYGDKDVVAFLNMQAVDNMTTVLANTAVRKMQIPMAYVDSVYLYNAQADLLLSTKNGAQYTLDTFYDTEITSYLQDPQRLLLSGGRPVAHTIWQNGQSSEICSYMVYELDKTGQRLLNALVINLSASALTNSITQMNAGNSNALFVVADADGRLIGAPDYYYSEKNRSAIDEIVGAFLQRPESGLTTVNVDDVPYLALCSNDNTNSWMLIGFLQRKVILQDMTNAAVLLVLLACGVFALTALLCLYLARRLNSPIERITRMVRGEEPSGAEALAAQPEEFAFLSAVFSSMKQQNQQFEAFRNDTEFAVKQDFLASLALGRNLYSLEKTQKLLEQLELQFISGHQLCVCILKIDDYKAFLAEKNQRECWAYRFSVVNIATELLSEVLRCEVASTNSDKFVAFIDCEQYDDYTKFSQLLLPTLHDLTSQIGSTLKLSMTVAYSSFFRGLERLPSIFQRTEELTQLKMRYGNGQVIQPQMLEDGRFERLEVTRSEEELLLELLQAGERQRAKEQLASMIEKLYSHSYNEIIPYAIHLDYMLYNAVCGKYPVLRDSLAGSFRDTVLAVSECETLVGMSGIITGFMEDICTRQEQLQQEATAQSSHIVVSRMLEIVESSIASKELCLNWVAEQVGLSANYIGGQFKAAQGVSLAKYISDKRMELVAHYMRTTKYPLPKILDLVGLEMSNYFYTTFKKYFGMSMGRYKLTVLGQTDDQTVP